MLTVSDNVIDVEISFLFTILNMNQRLQISLNLWTIRLILIQVTWNGLHKSANVRRPKSKSIYKKRKQYINSIKDEDIKAELMQGATLTSYFES